MKIKFPKYSEIELIAEKKLNDDIKRGVKTCLFTDHFYSTMKSLTSKLNKVDCAKECENHTGTNDEYGFYKEHCLSCQHYYPSNFKRKKDAR